MSRSTRFIAAAALLSLPVAPLFADHPETDKAGHSVQGEGFSEGPRQKAVLLHGLGDVHFPVTTGKPEAQQFFDQGVAQLHGFWFLEAERSFRQVLALDAGCTMAYWGMCMANVENSERAKEFIAKGMAAKQDHLTEKEKIWLKSLSDFYEKKKGGDDKKARLRNLVRDWEAICEQWPDDIEAKAFLVMRIWRNDAYEDIKVSSYLMLDALAREVLAKSPLHPGIHHYRIHLWNGEKDQQAVNSAATLGQTAPGIAHMWHMPGHTFTKLRRYPDAAWQQEASARVDHAHMIKFRVMPDEIHNYAHNNGWCTEDWLFTGRAHDAVEMSKNLIEAPRIPRSKAGGNTKEQTWDRGGSCYAEGRRRLLTALFKFELWDDVLRLENTPYLAPGDEKEDRDEHDRLLQLACLAHYETGDIEGGSARQATLQQRLTDLEKERDEAAATAEKKTTEEAEAEAKKEKEEAAKTDKPEKTDKTEKAKKPKKDAKKAAEDAKKGFEGRINELKRKLNELNVVSKLTMGDRDGAKTLLADLKDVPDDVIARYWQRAGDNVKAVELAKKASDADKDQVQPLANYAGVLLAAGREVEAKAEVEKLKPLCSFADGDLPVLKRLAPLLTGEWRPAFQWPADSGVRPPLDSLGPRHWEPSPAPAWELTDAYGKPHALKDYAGKPVLMIFFLGKICKHCMEQLNAFAPLSGDFAKAGIPIVAVSTDSVEGLHKTLGKDDIPFPFPLVSNEKLDAFKDYRAYDDFENGPLHATVLIDGQGLIRWQHISFEPFMKPDFVLKEAQRLLKMPARREAVLASKPDSEGHQKS